MLLAAGQRFCAGTNDIQRLIDFDFETLPEFLRCLCKNWYRFLKGCCCDLACIMASMIIVRFFRTTKAVRKQVTRKGKYKLCDLLSLCLGSCIYETFYFFIACPEIGLLKSFCAKPMSKVCISSTITVL